MIIKFSVSNFRSIKDCQELDFTASASKSKSQNLIAVNDKLTLLKSIVLYGANASGKTNVIRAFHSFRHFLLNSTDLKKGDPISSNNYDPFLLDKNSRNQPTSFKVEFIARDSKKYIYETRFDKESVKYESLKFYDTNQESTLFLRENAAESVTIYPKFNEKNVDTSILSNQLFFTKIGNSPNKQIGDLYLYFKEIEIWNTADTANIRVLYNRIQELFNREENETFRKRLSKLINISDTKINSVLVGSQPVDFDQINIGGISDIINVDKFKERLIKETRYQTFGVHDVYEDDKVVGVENLEFVKRESRGTMSIFAIGGLLINALLKETPTLIMLDEFDNSVHPELCRFLVELFHNPIVNKNGSQFAFATHETQLLDKDLFRRDQIWLAEKDDQGRSEFYSVIDFKDDDTLREGIPFDKWYKLGKLGGIPQVRKTEFFAEYES